MVSSRSEHRTCFPWMPSVVALWCAVSIQNLVLRNFRIGLTGVYFTPRPACPTLVGSACSWRKLMGRIVMAWPWSFLVIDISPSLLIQTVHRTCIVRSKKGYWHISRGVKFWKPHELRPKFRNFFDPNKVRWASRMPCRIHINVNMGFIIHP